MKLYFANNKYLTITSAQEEFKHGYYYLRVTLNSASITCANLLKMLTTDNTLSKLVLTDDSNKALAEWSEMFCSVYQINRNIADDGTTQIIFSSSADGKEESFLT